MVSGNSQGYANPTWGVDAALRYEFLKNKVASLTLSVSDIFRTRKSDVIVSRPAGAWITWQILPKPSQYSFAGTEGSSCIRSGVMRSRRRLGWTLNVRIIGVGCGQS